MNIPIVYICFGIIPEYLLLTIELASRNNPRVIVITNSYDNEPTDDKLSGAEVVILSKYQEGAKAFDAHYVHMARDRSSGRVAHELQCLQRWFILRDFMAAHGIDRVFFGDGDSALFVSASRAQALRAQCDAVINVDRQKSKTYWVGAGEASLWSMHAIRDFCRFTTNVYKQHLSTLAVKAKARTAVVDMSVLWLWWVAHKPGPGWNAGRPWLHHNRSATTAQILHGRNVSDEAFKFTKRLSLPKVNQSLHLCNGLDVVNGTVFDHKTAWEVADDFSLNLNSTGVPTVSGPCLRSGGVPEFTAPEAVAALVRSGRGIALNNVHYQGGAKSLLAYDVCRVLLLTGPRTIRSSRVVAICAKELAKHPGLPCSPRRSSVDGSVSCA